MNYFSFLILALNCFNILWLHVGIVEGIVGGQDVQPGQFKYQVAIFHNEVYTCSGVIFHMWHVLTASQCVLTANNEFVDGPLYVINGVHDFEKNKLYEVSAEVVSIYAPVLHQFDNPGASSSSNVVTGEVAVLKLDTRFNFNSNTVTSVKLKASFTSSPFLLAAAFRVENTIEGYVAGYGHQTVTETKDMTGLKYIEYGSDNVKLKYAMVKVLPYTQCQQTYFIDQRIHLCGQARQRNPQVPEGMCKGDEGSGLVLDDGTLIGILVKSSDNCNERDSVGLYAKIITYNPFITNVLRENISDRIRVKHLLPHAVKQPINVKRRYSKISTA